MDYTIPRHARLDQMTPAEVAIHDAMLAVEALPPDTRLTEAVTLLDRARSAVADYVDSRPLEQFRWIPEAPNYPGLYAAPTPTRSGKLGEMVHYGTHVASSAVQHVSREECQLWCDAWNAEHPEVGGGTAWVPREHGFYNAPTTPQE